MKILFCSFKNPHFVTITEYVEQALLDLGHEVVFFDDRQFIIPGRIRARFPFAENIDLARINRKLLQTIDQEKPDIFFAAGGHRILPSAIDQIKLRNIKTVLWTIDAPLNFEPIIEAAPHYDFTFCGGSEAVEILNNYISNPIWLPFACDAGVHQPAPADAEARRYASDLVFVGSYYPNRFKVLEKLVDFDLKVWGPGWEKVPTTSPLAKCIHPRQLKPDAWMQIFGAAKIVIILHYRDGIIPCYQASPKVYETLACGAFALVDNQPDVLASFTPDSHLAIFDSDEDMVKKVNYYLKRPEERQRIAGTGRHEVLARHTYRHRMAKMLTAIRGNC